MAGPKALRFASAIPRVVVSGAFDSIISSWREPRGDDCSKESLKSDLDRFEAGSLRVASFAWRLKGTTAVEGRVLKADVCAVFSVVFIAEVAAGLKKAVG